jgi:hypothetical protein
LVKPEELIELADNQELLRNIHSSFENYAYYNSFMKGNVQISISVGICSVFFYRCISRVGGRDLSFIKGDECVACAALIVCELPKCEVMYEDITMVPLTVLYVPNQAGDTRMDSSSATNHTVVRVGQAVQPLWAAESK